MAESNAYTSDTAHLQRGIQDLRRINEMAQEIWKAYNNAPRENWMGNNDSFAKQMRPQVEKEQAGVSQTLEGIKGGIGAVTDGTDANLKNIRATQDGNISAIHDSARGAKRTGTGRH